MHRRIVSALTNLVLTLGVAAAAAQPSALAKIGTLDLTSGPTIAFDGLREGLSELGYVEGKNYVFIQRYAAGDRSRLQEFASQLLQLRVDVIATGSTEVVQTIQKMSRQVPIVMTSVSDPIGSGLAKSYSRPGGKVTGMTLFSTDLATKRLDLLMQAIPGLTNVAVLVERDHIPTVAFVQQTKEAARGAHLGVRVFEVRADRGEIEAAFTAMSREHIGALIVQQTQSFNDYIGQIAALAMNQRLPAIHEQIGFGEAGGLVSYGPNRFDLGKKAAGYIDKILRGANPGDLPIEQPSKFELILNARTAKALGVTLPQSLLLRADKVIE